jgi:hypothetical protein
MKVLDSIANVSDSCFATKLQGQFQNFKFLFTPDNNMQLLYSIQPSQH